MTDQTNESLSALMDGELSELELRKLLKQNKAGEVDLETWQRYNKTRSALHGSSGLSDNNFDISASVMAEIETLGPHEKVVDTPVEEPADNRVIPLWKSLSSMAVAATVTAVVILGAQYQNQDQAVSPSVADNRIQVDIPVLSTPENFQRTQLSPTPIAKNEIKTPTLTSQERLERGVARYLSQHKFVQSNLRPHWNVTWLPEGAVRVNEHIFASGSEVVAFASQTSEFSVSVEPLGRQALPTGRVQGNGVVAVGKPVGDVFIAVVGSLSLADAEKVLAAVVPISE